jgi:hypothetical protein
MIFAVGLLILFRWKSTLSMPVAVLAAAIAGLVVSS